MPPSEQRPRGRRCFKCGVQWIVSRDVHRIRCASCGEHLTPYCPINDYHEVRPLSAKPGEPLRFNCVNGCILKGFTQAESEAMRSARAGRVRFFVIG